MKKTAFVVLVLLVSYVHAAENRYMASTTIQNEEFKLMVGINANRVGATVQNLGDHALYLDLQTSYVQLPKAGWSSLLTDNFAGRPAPPSVIMPPGLTRVILYAASSIKETDNEEHDVKFRWPALETAPVKFNLQIYGPDGVRKDYVIEGQISKTFSK